MAFCDELCCFNIECKLKGTLEVNYSGYHKVCENHVKFIKNNFFKCDFCESIVLQTLIPIPESLSNENEVNENSLNENEISMDSNEDKNVFCFDCREVCDIKTLDCGHKVCSNCYSKTFCEICYKREEIGSYPNWYETTTSSCICINCNNKHQYPNTFTCGHFACNSCIISKCSKCYTDVNQGPCSSCGQSAYLYKAMYFYETNFQDSECTHMFCWTCKENSETCRECEKEDEYQAGLNSCDSYSKDSNSEVENEDSSILNHINVSSKRLDEKNESGHLSINENLYPNSTLIIKDSSNEASFPNYSFKLIRNSKIYKETSTSVDLNQNSSFQNSENSKNSIIQELPQDSFVGDNIECKNCSQLSIPVKLKCHHEGCKLCETEEKCKDCNEQNQILCINCKKLPQNYAVFKCKHVACSNCIYFECSSCSVAKEKCSNCGLDKYLCIPIEWKKKNTFCDHNVCFDCISQSTACKECKNGQIEEEEKKSKSNISKSSAGKNSNQKKVGSTPNQKKGSSMLNQKKGSSVFNQKYSISKSGSSSGSTSKK